MALFGPYLVLFGIVFGVNLLPAFGPPTWSIIVLYGLNSELPVPAIILVGALAAASGRLVLAHAFRLLGTRVSEKTRSNLTAAREAFERNRKGGIVALGLFALSPVPSAQLFEAAGLAGVKLLGFTAAFFCGRIVSYSIYAYSAKGVKESSFGEVLAGGISSPLGIGLQLAMIAALIALARIDWAKLISRKKGGN
ncbi:hypothetical protein SZ64_01780 [Erythrobacter sp. SG61-1L]|nr:hypothetical protein SZ64_01780 [Erythrobacter sp. SG61-1L]